MSSSAAPHQEPSPPAAAGAAANNNKSDDNNETDEDYNRITQSFPPSHILQDGRFIHLPPPNVRERSYFFERAIAQYGLLQKDIERQKTSKTTTTSGDKTKEEEAAAVVATAEAVKDTTDAEAVVASIQKDENDDDTVTNNNKASEQPQVHPLAIASARIQALGIAELNRAINLSTLVQTGEYFGWTNIVDPTLEMIGTTTTATATPTTTEKKKDTTGGGGADGSDDKKKKEQDGSSTPKTTNAATTSTAVQTPGTSSSAPTKNKNEKEMYEEQCIKAAYVLKRKRAQFEYASHVLTNHEKRMKQAIVAQAIPDLRLRQLRQHWRIVAPEHGIRAKPHATRPTEIIAIDVDVYDHKSSTTTASSTRSNISNNASLVGRLASRVPRYATIELDTNKFTLPKDSIKKEDNNNNDDDDKKMDDGDNKVKREADNEGDDDAMDIDANDKKSIKKEEKDDYDQQDEMKEQESGDIKNESTYKPSLCTIAEPFAIADPTLGKISTDFDPNKVTMLTLQFDIEKPSTGFCMSACLQPMTRGVSLMEKEAKQQQQDKNIEEKKKSEKDETTSNSNDKKEYQEYQEDEQVLVSLQHSLFCAKLFESIRRELMGDDAAVDERGQPLRQHQNSVVWLTSESEENYLPPPSLMIQSIGGDASATAITKSAALGGALCVVHCHESEVKVQLDAEYTLRAKLVEANDGLDGGFSGGNDGKSSGSQSPEQLLVLCRSLLLHAQEEYHNHSLYQRAEQEKKRQQAEADALSQRPKGLDRIQKKEVAAQAKILQSCVALGTKMLFERRIRKALLVSTLGTTIRMGLAA